VNKRAFTLVEILLVIAILAVLSGIAFAAFGPARETGRQRSCASNLRQIGIAIGLYIADYDGLDPTVGVRMDPSQLGLPVNGATFFRTYLKDRSTAFCPSYHGTQPISQLGSTYYWPVFANQESVPELDLPGVVARRGADYVLVGCDQHNARLDFSDQARWEMKKVIVLRLSQQVQVKQVPARTGTQSDW
jgi:prepilin-type N-terminal cleavage/methylation domain-containing protein